MNKLYNYLNNMCYYTNDEFLFRMTGNHIGCPKKNALLCSKAPRGPKKLATDESGVSFEKFRKFPV